MKHMVKMLAAAAAFALAAPAFATSHQSTLPGFTQGEVRKVDKAAGKVTLRHGPIANLEMPPMTMVFKVKEPAMLEKLKEGDKVSFKAEMVQGAYVVTELSPGKP
jgi:Cu/Ag efflux protein CusF